MKNVILIFALLLSISTVLSQSAWLTPLTRGTNGIMTNTQLRVTQPISTPGGTVGVVASFQAASTASGVVTFYLQRSYDTNFSTLWETNLTFALTASGTNVMAVGTNATFNDFPYARVAITNNSGTAITNVSVKLYNVP